MQITIFVYHMETHHNVRAILIILLDQTISRIIDCRGRNVVRYLSEIYYSQGITKISVHRHDFFMPGKKFVLHGF